MFQVISEFRLPSQQLDIEAPNGQTPAIQKNVWFIMYYHWWFLEILYLSYASLSHYRVWYMPNAGFLPSTVCCPGKLPLLGWSTKSRKWWGTGIMSSSKWKSSLASFKLNKENVWKTTGLQYHLYIIGISSLSKVTNYYTPWKKGPNPKGNEFSLPTIHFQGQAVKLRGCNLTIKTDPWFITGKGLPFNGVSWFP